MGLDMYLEKSIYVGNHYTTRKVEGSLSITVDDKLLVEGLEDLASVRYRVAYWRKANAIHKWFVDHVQDGVDDCGEYYVGVGKLKKLLDTCKKVLKNIAASAPTGSMEYTVLSKEKGTEKKVCDTYPEGVADGLLPVEGFFFGDTTINDFYIEDLKMTIEALEKALGDEPSGCSFYYTSSW